MKLLHRSGALDSAALVVGRVEERANVDGVHHHSIPSLMFGAERGHRVRKNGEPPTVPFRIASKMAVVQAEVTDLQLGCC